ncbi:saccharopine dehydrogenase [Kribbella sp. NPDC051718]|uniref:saccharopine dehydrogenase n=1 Tax=Kribbella sp. NPDC051718 TaxID=3155168 RepID=UPI00344A4FB0
MKPVLILGGSGQAGAGTARLLRQWHPDLPLTIAGRDLARAQRVADELGTATALSVDLHNLELATEHSAVVALLRDDRFNGLRYAQDNAIPYFSISSGPMEIAPEVAAVAHRPNASAVMLASHFFAGTVALATLQAAKSFGQLDSIHIRAIQDEQDIGGPAALADLERWATASSAGLVRRDGVFTWLADEPPVEIQRADGTTIPAQTVAGLDIPGLAFATGAPNVQVDFAVSKEPGQPLTEVRITLEGTDPAGTPLRTTHSLINQSGQRPLTALGIALGVERLLGLQGTPAHPGIHTPESLIDPTYAMERLAEVGATFAELECATTI